MKVIGLKDEEDILYNPNKKLVFKMSKVWGVYIIYILTM